MIHILPRIEYSIDSTKSPEEINTILKSVTTPWGIVPPLSYGVIFIGEVNPSDFKVIIYNKFGFKNVFRPVIEGTIKTERGLTVIDIKMRLSLFVLIFCIICFGGAGLELLVGLFTGITKGLDGVAMLFGAAVLFVFGLTLARIGVYFSGKTAMKKLEELLK